MAIFSPIPMPQNPMDAFSTGYANSQKMFDTMMANQMRPYQVRLMQAQAQEAEGKAAKAKMFANLIGQVIGVSPDNEMTSSENIPENQPIQSNPNESNIAPMQNEPNRQELVDKANQDQIQSDKNVGIVNPYLQGNKPAQPSTSNIIPPISDKSRKGLTLAALLGIQTPGETIEGKRAIFNPLTGDTTVTQIGQTPEQKELTEAHGKATGKALEDINASYEAGQNLKDSVAGLRDLMANPRYKNIAGTAEAYFLNAKPLGFPLGAALKNVYSKEDQDLLGQANTHMGNIIVAVQKQFKGTFRNFINGLINTMKPNVNDPIAIQQGKLKGLETLGQLGLHRTEMVDQLITQGYTPIQAMLRADKMVPFSQIKSQVENAANLQKLNNEQKTENVKNPVGTVVMYKDGNEYHIPKEKAESALKAKYSYAK